MINMKRVAAMIGGPINKKRQKEIDKAVKKAKRAHDRESFDVALQCLKRRAQFLSEEEYQERYKALKRRYFPSNSFLTPKRER